MNDASIRKIIALGAITGMRSMAGAAALAVQHGGVSSRVVPILAAAEMIEAKVADCPTPMRRAVAATQPPQCTAQGCSGGGRSDDGTLDYRYTTEPNGARTLRVTLQ